MPVRVNKAEFLQNLEAVQAGLSPREIVEQSNCFVFKDRVVMTYNDEVSCRAKSLLPKDFEGAVQAAPLLAILGKLDEEEVEVEKGEGELLIKGKKRRVGINMEKDILIPIATVEQPAAEAWKKIPEDFLDAVGIVQECAGKDESQFALTCVHIHPKFMEACDNYQITRYKLRTGVEKPTLVKRESIKHVTNMDVTEFAETGNWFHFRNATGLIVSCRRYVEDYPDMKPILTVGNAKPASLPKGLTGACEKAEIFSSENADNNQVLVELRPGKLKIKGVGTSGWYSEVKGVKYDGAAMSFLISPKLLTEITKRHNECAVSLDRLIVNGGRWKYVTCLGTPPEANGQAKKGQESTEEV